MKSLIAKILLICSVFFTSYSAWSFGGLYVEPGITYESFDSSIDWPSPLASSTGSSRGLGLLARLGFHIDEALFVAIDGRYSRPTFKDSSSNVDSTATSSSVGPVLGLQMPSVGLRVWGQYVFDGSLDPETSNGYDYIFQNAKGYRAGLGFHISSFSINLEYQDLKYETKLQQIGGFTVNSTFSRSDLTSKGFVAGVSFPVEL